MKTTTDATRSARAAPLRCGLAAGALALAAVPGLPTDAAAATYSAPLQTAIADLPVAAEQRDGYDRELFSDWVTTDGCTTRELVLIEEETTGAASASDCGGPIPGEWYSVYDDVTVTDPSDLDIDHVVPLAEAWDSGAHAWTPEQRADYATHLTDPDHLIAVTAGSNRAKADADPAEWMPDNEDAWCDYLVTWIEIKLTWDLTVDQAEYNAITNHATGC